MSTTTGVIVDRPPLLDLLEQARPYAEQLVYRAGILPHSFAGGNCTDGANDVMGAWRNLQLEAAERREAESGTAPDREFVIEDAAYVLGIAVGLQLRGGVR